MHIRTEAFPDIIIRPVGNITNNKILHTEMPTKGPKIDILFPGESH